MHISTALSMSSPPSSSIDTLSQRRVERVFDRLTGQLGGKMADLYAGVEPRLVQGEWAAGLAGFHDAEIARGLAACRTRVFAPTLGEFLRLCRPCLDADIAWMEADAGLRARAAGHVGEWTHPAVYRAACRMSLEIQRDDYARCKKRWAWELARELAEGWGSDVPTPVLRIEADVRGVPPPPEMRNQLSKLRAMLAGEEA